MEIPLTLTDYLNRAELVYGDQIAVIDEPDQPAQPLKGLTYKELSNSARSLAAELDELGIELGSRIAMVSQNSARMLIFLFGTSAFGSCLLYTSPSPRDGLLSRMTTSA